MKDIIIITIIIIIIIIYLEILTNDPFLSFSAEVQALYRRLFLFKDSLSDIDWMSHRGHPFPRVIR